MKKCLILFTLICTVCLLLSGCNDECEHNYADADCEKASYCIICGIVNGEPLGHDYKVTDCTAAKICKRCGSESAISLGHIADVDDGDCTTPVGCINCAKNAVEATNGHIDADSDLQCDNPGCTVAFPDESNDGIDLPELPLG